MKTFNYRSLLAAVGLAALFAAGSRELHGQTAYWTNSSGGDWNVAANWDLDFLGINVVPAEATNASLTTAGAVTVDYNAPMAATSFGALTVDSGATLNINAAGFTQDLGGVGTAPLTLGSGVVNVGASGVWTATNGGPITINSGGILNVGGDLFVSPVAATAPLSINAGGQFQVAAGGVATISDGGGTAIAGTGVLSVTGGALVFTNSGTLTLGPGASVGVTNGVLEITNATSATAVLMGVNNNTTATPFIIDGGTVNLSALLDIKGHFSRVVLYQGTLNCFGNSRMSETGNDRDSRIEVNGGVANIGSYSVAKSRSTGGFIVNGGVVNATGLQVGYWNSQCYATINGGFLTNTGPFTINDRVNAATSGDRRVRFLIRGGTVVSTDAAGIIVANQANAAVGGSASVHGGILDINSGTLIAEGITLVKDNTLTNAHANLVLAGTGSIYLGSAGLNGNVGPINSSYSIAMSGGTLGAHNNFAINGNITLTGTAATFRAADPAGNPFDITANGVISSSGVLTKTGGGILTLNNNNTYSGVTTISAGTLALGIGGTIVNSPQITVASGATFDVSAVAPYNLASGKILQGSGTVSGSLVADSAAVLRPAGAGAVGTLTFSGGLTQNGGVLNEIEFNPLTNDVIEVVGDLDLNPAATNTFVVSSISGGIAPGTYTLIHYTGTLLNGGATNFVLSGIPGTLVHDIGAKTISVTTSGLRAPTSIFWVGTGGGGDWDALSSLNWNDGAPGAFFVNGDTVRFDAAGAANPAVNLTVAVSPTSVTVDAASDYTFSGGGNIGGTGGLLKTNTGKLTIATANAYTGGTAIRGGILSVSTIASGGFASGLGASGAAAANLVLDAGTLEYTGATVSSDRGATLGTNGATMDVTSSATTLTLSGVLTGDGSLAKAGAGVLALGGANNYTNGSAINGGVLQLNVASAAGSGGITNNGATLRVSGATTIDNQIEFIGTTGLEFTGVGSGNVPLRGAWTGNGTVNVNFLTQNASQTLSIGGEGAGGGHMWDFAGTVDFGTTPGFVRLNNNSSINFGSSNAVFNLGTSNLIFVQRNGGTITHLGALIGGPNTRLSGARNDVSGTTTYSIGGRNLDTVFAGMITNGQSGSSIRPASIIKVGTGKLTLTGLSPYTGATTVEAGTLQVDGQITASPITVTGGALTGNGTISGAVDIQFNTILAPGNSSIGQLTIGSLTLGFGSTNYMEIDKANGTNDSVVGLSSVSYAGNLVINNLGGTLADGDTFKLFDATPGSYFGAYETIALPSLGANLFWDTSNLTVDGTIRVYTPRPAITGFGIDGSNLFLTGTNGGNTSTHYIVLTSTNVAAPGGTWTPLVTNAFSFDGSFAFTNAVNLAEPARFFQVKTP